MLNSSYRPLFAVVVVAALAIPAPAAAQAVEIAPFAGYRIGPTISAFPGAVAVRDDGGFSFGVVVDVPIGVPSDGLSFEALFSRERADAAVRTSWLDPYASVPIEVDHLMVGGIQELDDGAGRPFIGGLVGLSRFAAPGVTDIRFTVGISAGAKFYATRNLGLRLDARGYVTIVSVAAIGRCAGGCALAFNVSPAFQADLTAAVIVAF